MKFTEFYNQKDKWILMIHCICGNENIFKYQFKILSKEYNLILVRLPGHFEDVIQSKVSFKYVIENIHDYVTKKKIKKIDIMGISLGAMIASDYISKYPEEVENTILIGSIYNFSIHFFRFLYRILICIDKFLPRRIYMFLITYILLPSYVERKQRKKLFRNSLRMNKKVLNKWMYEMYIFMKSSEKKIKNVFDTESKVTFIYGEKDKIFLNYSKKILKKLEKESRLCIVHNSGHICNIQNFKEFNDILKEVLL